MAFPTSTVLMPILDNIGPTVEPHALKVEERGAVRHQKETGRNDFTCRFELHILAPFRPCVLRVS